MAEFSDQPILEYASPLANARVRPAVPGVVRVCGAVAGVLLPLVCFAFSVAGFPLGPEWKSGRFEDYVMLFLSAKSAWPFFPLLLGSMVCMGLACARPRTFGPRLVVRVGVYGGIVLAAQYCLIMVLSTGGSGGNATAVGVTVGALATAVPFGLMALLNSFFRRWGTAAVWKVLGVVTGTLALGGLLVGGRYFLGAMAGCGVLSLLVAPGWALAAYAAMSVCLAREARAGDAARPTSGAWVTAWTAWWAAFGGTWVVAVQQAIRAYQALPTTQPSGCYVATAAARGHRRFVQAETCGGRPVNDQLRRLKCAEIALAVVAPRAHRSLRRAYDRVGPALAAGLAYPVLADVAYALLKPAEWAAVFVMRRTIPGFDGLARGVYSGSTVERA